MIDEATLADLLHACMPDAEFSVEDWSGTGDHLNLWVRSRSFAGLSLLDQHRLIYNALDAALKDGRIHALQIRTEILKEQTMSETSEATQDTLQAEIEQEIGAHTILIYAKGTKSAPRCGFTIETIDFFNRFGYPFEVIDALANEAKRAKLTEITNWPTLPKVFIDGTFYGDTDILEPMAQNGELIDILKKAFEGREPQKPEIINLASR